jgi:integrase
MAKEPIKRSKNGTYHFRVHLGFDTSGKRIQKYCSGFRTKKEAREKYYELSLQKDDLLTKEINSVNFRQYINEIFLPWYKSRVKIQTFSNRINAIRKHFPYFFKYNLGEIEAIYVQKWQVALSKKYKPSYVRNVQGMFSMAMERAVILNLCEHNPSKIVGNVKKQKIQISFWTKSEFEAVLSQIDITDYYQYFQYVCLWLLFMTGMRIGEATALLWEDIDFDANTLNICKTLHYKNQQDYRFGEPKTKASNRRIVLDKDTMELLQQWREVQKKAITHERFILSYNGVPTQKNLLSRIIRRYAKMANIDAIRTHDLRHSHASLLIELGENPLIIRDRLGHEDIETTLGTYGHLYPNSNYEVANKLNGIIHIATAVTAKKQLTSNQHTVLFQQNVQ